MVWIADEPLLNVFLDLDNNTWDSIKDMSPKEAFESLSEEQKQVFLDSVEWTLEYAFQQRDDEDKKEERRLAFETARIQKRVEMFKV